MASNEKKQAARQTNSGTSEMLRRFKRHPILFIGSILFLTLIIVAFVFVPAIVPGAMGVENLAFGYYNGTPIRHTPGSFFSQTRRNVESNFPDIVNDPTMARSIWRVAFNEAVVNAAILDEVRRAGNIVVDDAINREIAQLFQENGRFMADRYRSLDNATRLSLHREASDRLMAQRYYLDLASIRSSDAEAAFVSAMASPRRVFGTAIFPLSSFPDSEVVLFAGENENLFMANRFSRITLGSEREARQVLDMVRNGSTTFEEAARTNSTDSYADIGGDMGSRMRFELSFEITNEADRDAVMSLAHGDISDVVRVSNGWAFFRALDTALPVDTEDSAQFERVRSYMLSNHRGIMENWLIEQAESFSEEVRRTNFTAAALRGNVFTNTFGPLPVNYGDSLLFTTVRSSGVPELQFAGNNLFFWQLAFNTPLNTPSEPLVIGDNVLVLYPIEESNEDEVLITSIESTFRSSVLQQMESSFRSSFLADDNPKFDNRFDATFDRFERFFGQQ